MEQGLARGCPDKPSSPRASGGGGASYGAAARRRCSALQGGAGAGAAVRSRRRDPPARPTAFPFFPFPPSYTHRHRCEVARAPGGSGAGGRIPPPRFVWQILKIDCGLTNVPGRAHADSYLVTRGTTPPRVGGRRRREAGRPWGRRRCGSGVPVG